MASVLRQVAPRFGGFSLAALLPVVSSFVLFPVLARSAAPDEWVGIAVGQSVGLVGAAAVNLGWNVLGPAQVAELDRRQRDAAYVDSLWSRGTLWLLLAPLAAVVAAALSPEGGHGIAAAVAVAFTASGLSPRWFAVAEARPRQMIVWDVMPMVVSNLVAGVAIVLGASLLTYPVLLASTFAGAALLFPTETGGRRPGLRRIARSFRGRLAATVGELCGSSYSAATVALVASQAAASAMPEYASGFRLYQWGLIVLVALTNALQAWAAAPGAGRGDRFAALLKVHVAVGLLGLVALTVAGPLASRILFGDELGTSLLVCAGLGLAYVGVAISTALARHVLVVERRINIAVACTAGGCLVGIPVTLLLARNFGVAGGAFGLAISELVVVAIAAPTALSIMRGLGQPGQDVAMDLTRDRA